MAPNPKFGPSDEWEFGDPQALLNIGMGPEVHTNNILWYFTYTAWYDQTSNNSALITRVQHMPPPERDHLLFNRVAFEKVLREQYPNGRQYVVAPDGEPKAPGEPWVVRCENRWLDNERRSHVDVEGVWYCVGINWFKAPTLGAVVQARLLSISNRMRIFLETASEFVNYSPGAGYSYIPDSLEKPTAPGAGSRTGSIIPGGTEGPQPTEEQHEAEFSDDFFMQSLNLTNRFGDEYMDENPLQGEPGSFVFQRTNAQIRAMHKAEEAAAANKAATGASSMTIRPQ